MQPDAKSGQVKATSLSARIRRGIIEGRGICVIDPHRQLYEDLVRWLEQHDPELPGNK
jgi:hypothetical protein